MDIVAFSYKLKYNLLVILYKTKFQRERKKEKKDHRKAK